MSKNGIPTVMLQSIENDLKKDFELKNYLHQAITPETLDRLNADVLNYLQGIRNSRCKNLDEPLFDHDCKECIYLGDMLDVKMDDVDTSQVNICYYDFYAHSSKDSVCLIARYGDNPQDYLSMSYFLDVPLEENPIYNDRLFLEILHRWEKNKNNNKKAARTDNKINPHDRC